MTTTFDVRQETPRPRQTKAEVWSANDTLLYCGILSSLVYVGADVLASSLYEGYSYTAQTISELSAIGAPTRKIMVAFTIPYNALVILFGFGVWRTVRSRSVLRLAAASLIAFATAGFTAPVFAMHVRGSATSLTDTMHIVLTLVDLVLILATVTFAAWALGTRFRVYSMVTVTLVVVFGGLTGLQGPALAANEPTPWMGVLERISIYAFMIWNGVLAVALVRQRLINGPTTDGDGDRRVDL